MTKTILLADDSVTIQKVIELTFMDQDYDIDAVSNGDDAVARLRESSPDFVIADVHMPGASGYEVAEESKRRHPDVPVLLLVGTFEKFDVAQFQSCGADGNLKKPFDSQELLRLVSELSTGDDADEPEAKPTFVLGGDAEGGSPSPFSIGEPISDEMSQGDDLSVTPASKRMRLWKPRVFRSQRLTTALSRSRLR